MSYDLSPQVQSAPLPPLPPQPAPQRARPRWLLLALGAVAVLALLAGGLFVVKGFVGGGNFTVTGTMQLPESGFTKSGATCAGTGGYNDIRQGAQVVVTDAGGTTVAIGALGPGQPSGYWCVFHFDVSGVPAGQQFYGVTVTHRGTLQYDSTAIRKPLQLSLGS